MKFKHTPITKYKAQFYFTSEANSYGFINNEWMEGNVMAVSLDGNKNSKKIKIIPEKHTFLQSKSKCSEQGSYYECVGKKLAEADFSIKGVLKGKVVKCPKACSVYSFPNLDTSKIPTCTMYHSDTIEPEKANKNKAFLKKSSGIFKKNKNDDTKQNEIDENGNENENDKENGNSNGIDNENDNAEELESNKASEKNIFNLLQGSENSNKQSTNIADVGNIGTNNTDGLDSNEKSEKKNIFNSFKKGNNDIESDLQ